MGILKGVMLMSEARAFLSENAIYEYMNYRAVNGGLKMRQVVKDGVPQKSKKAIYVTMAPIKNTRFPDIEEIIINGISRKGEIKFLTSLFEYHEPSKYSEEAYKKFVNDAGCVIVLKHDYVPKQGDFLLDVYELELDDFLVFAKENFNRLINKQLRIPPKVVAPKIWMFCQSANFHGLVDPSEKKNANLTISPANETGIWCPSIVTQIDKLEAHDKVIFVRYRGDKRNAIRNNVINESWKIIELYIGEIVKIQSREDYCKEHKKNKAEQLWIFDKTSFKYVFTFKRNRVLPLDVKVKSLSPEIINLLHLVYTQPSIREISKDIYSQLLEECLEKHTITNINVAK